jgi:ferredoxin
MDDGSRPARKTILMSGAGLETASSAIERTGLVPRGAFLLSDEEQRGALADVCTIVLAGMAGRSGWEAFAASPEAADGAEHPLDRWSRRLVEGLARDLGATALFPFGGPPFWPFQQWARRSEPVHPSPIGLLIQPTYGLWHSYRGALGFREALDVPELEAVASPCESCEGRWCLNTCPVGAFSPAGYDVSACAGHLQDAAGADCMSAGCRARRACPVGAEHAYGEEQESFIMRAFLRARNAP